MFSKAALRALLLTLLFAAHAGAALARRGLQLHVRDEKAAAIAYAGFVVQQLKDSLVIYNGITDSAGDFSGAGASRYGMPAARGGGRLCGANGRNCR